MKKPFFSIIVALAPGRKAEILESLKNINYNKAKYEVIVKQGLNPSENRNNAIKEAKGDIIAVLDDDVFLDENILINAEKFFNAYPNIGLVGGPQLTPETDNFFARVSGYVLESSFGAYKMSTRYKKNKLNLDTDETSLTSANCFARKDVFDKVGNFNPILYPGEDPEFFGRVKKNNIKIAYSPDLIVYHKRRNNFFSFCKQIYNYGRVRLTKEKLNKTFVNPIFIMPLLFVFYLILLPILYIKFKILIFPLLLYFILNMLFSFKISLEKEPYAFPLLMILFFAMHISYGLGMLSHFFSKSRKVQKQKDI